jgi:hypothetical protein
MPLPPNYLDSIANARDPSSGSLVVPWPMPGNPAHHLSFATFAEWPRALPSTILGVGNRAQIARLNYRRRSPGARNCASLLTHVDPILVHSKTWPGGTLQ